MYPNFGMGARKNWFRKLPFYFCRRVVLILQKWIGTLFVVSLFVHEFVLTLSHNARLADASSIGPSRAAPRNRNAMQRSAPQHW